MFLPLLRRDESQSIKRILEWIQCKLSFTLPSISKNLVGIDSRLKGKIETISFDMPRAKEARWNMKAFSKMTKLRLLKIHNVNVYEGPEYLSNELRFLEWHAYPSKSLPACFQPDELVELYMSCSSIEQLWYGCKLRLDGTAIVELPSSFHRLVGLILLSMSRCKNLESIPSGISGLKSLKKLDVSDCFELKSIPENLGKVESLEEFDASGTSIRQPPMSFFLLKNLKLLSFNGCKRLAVNLTNQVLPSLSGLCSLEELDLRACNLGEGAIPEDIGFLSSLRSLNLSRNNFVSLPESINRLSRLEKLALKDCVMLESLPEVPLNVQKVKLDGCLRLKEIPNPIKLSSMKRSEFKCLNCWELYNHNGQNKMGLKMLEKYLQGSLPRPGFSIVVPGNDVPDWFNHQSKESSIRVQVPRNEWMGFAACVAFSTYGKSPLFCYFKVDGKESYPSQMYIGCNSMQAVSDHLWIFYLSFDYLKDLKEQDNEAFNNLELSFDSYEQQVKVKYCGVRLVNSPSTPSWQSSTGHLIVASKEAVSSYSDSLTNSLCYNQWMHDVFHSFRGVHSSNNFTNLCTTLIQSGIIRDRDKLELLRVIWSSLLGEIKESGLSIIIFARDYACSHLWAEELVKIGGFIKKMKPDTIFPVSTISYNDEQSKVYERTESYTIVFDKDEEDFSEYKKVRRWMNILTKVAIPSSESSKSYSTLRELRPFGNCHLIVASKEAASSYIDSPSKSLCYIQWMLKFFYSFRGVNSSNNLIQLQTTLVERGIIRDRDHLEFLRAIQWSLVNDMDWPVGNRFHGTDLQCVQNFRKKIDGERNKWYNDFEFDVTQLFLAFKQGLSFEVISREGI
ncbi:hypothetical protein SADUNF_Sadunf13G0077500 [Salix dunnii]|uniref:TIR domain-containing protein n=1 Tax=Salix dunnii TaxID=1413687 RepID=A0A835MNG7_9ROSI|nr:hypothetical protein SADUNF_Sadunf13G0077500 [Salix dunnii]